MRYLNGTPDFGLLYLANDNIAGFSDADWAGDHDDQKSTSGLDFIMSGATIAGKQEINLCSFINRSRIHRIGKCSSGIDMIQ